MSARGHVDQETKEAFAEGTQTFKQAMGQFKAADTPSQILSIALLLHTAIGLFSAITLYFQPKRLIPGYVKEVAWTDKVGGAPGAVLHLLALKGLGMSVITGLAAFSYDAKHKALLNSALLIHHLSVLAEVWSQRSNFSGFSMPPNMVHIPLAVLHGLAVASYYRPDLIGGAKRAPYQKKH